MDAYTTEALIGLGTELTKLAVKGTATGGAKRVKAIKNEKDADVLRRTYDEIITELLAGRDEAVMLAQTYKGEVDRFTISDKDIEHLQNTASSILAIIPTFSNEVDIKALEPIKKTNKRGYSEGYAVA